jgi:DNA-directed RNA polymerase specialized sigma24 family protein
LKLQGSIRRSIDPELEASIRRIIEQRRENPAQQSNDYETARNYLRKRFWSSLYDLSYSPDEILHDVMVRTLATQDRRGELGSATAWFTEVARNLVIDKFRERSRSVIANAVPVVDAYAQEPPEINPVDVVNTLQGLRRFVERMRDPKLLEFLDLLLRSHEFDRHRIKVITTRLGIDRSEYNALWKRLRLASRRFGGDSI